MSRTVLITGGAGFVGANLADRLLSLGREVLILDNLSRPGVEANAGWLLERYPGKVQVEIGDVRDTRRLAKSVDRCSTVFHCAAQVAATIGFRAPIEDFETNARGTLNLLEAIRARSDQIPLFFASTSKIYGPLGDLALSEGETRYQPTDPTLRERGISEARPLDLHGPHGCSRGCADTYVLDYARTFGLPAVVFRMSSIYGPRQLGTEDDGWVAHFLNAAISRAQATVYGDGKQVRDLLYINDLIDALLLAEAHLERAQGRAFNIGGGPKNTLSLLELIALVERHHRLEVSFRDWRSGDQRYYVSDTTRFEELTGWRPRIAAKEGIAALLHWLEERRHQRKTREPAKKVQLL
jgi:CDP-paratose 2-epimerase